MGSRTFVKQKPVPLTEQLKIKRSHLAGIDLVLLTALIFIVVFGLIMVYSASTDYSVVVLDQAPTYMFFRQVLWLLIGSLLAGSLVFIDYHHFQKLAVPIIVITIVGLLLVVIFGEFRNGAIRTFYNGSIQPSEFAKVATIIYLSVWLYRKKETLHIVNMGLVPLGVIVGVIAGLIFLQPDLSATITIIILGILLFFLADGELKQMGLIFLVAGISVALLISVWPYGKDRIASFIQILRDPTTAQGQSRRFLSAIINGKFFGVGLGRSNAKLTGLEVAPTDSIFAVLVEETGLLGAIILIALYGILIWRGLRISSRAPDMLGSLMAAGLTFWIGIEAIINMGMIVGILPVAGNALPFISAGGSSLVSYLIATGILMNISRQGNDEKKVEERRLYGASVDWRGRDRRRRVSRPRRTASNAH